MRLGPCKMSSATIAMQRQPRGAGAHGDAQSFESKQFTQCFGELNFFQHLVYLLGLRAAFKLSSTKTTVASMVRGSLVKSPRDGKEIPRLLCSLAMEEFLSWCCGNAIVILEWNTRLGSKAAARQRFLEMLQDFCDIFVDGLCIHSRSLRTTRDDLFDPHCSPVAAGMPRGIGMIWTSTPVAAAMTRRLKNYGERRNLFEADYLRDERLYLFVAHYLRERGVSMSAVHRRVGAM
jgi:hypothetical protein